MQKTLKTERLILRKFVLEDSGRVQKLAGDKRIADMTTNIPHPYLDGMAETWISSHEQLFKNNKAIVYAIVLSSNEELIGTVSLSQITKDDANLGYWLGVPYWGKGYATEAVKTLVGYAFNELSHPMIHAQHLVNNLASKNVIKKCGFKYIADRELSMAGQVRQVKHYELCNRACS